MLSVIILANFYFCRRIMDQRNSHMGPMGSCPSLPALLTRKHSSMMRTTRLPMVRASVTKCQYRWGGGGSSSEKVWTGLQWWPPGPGGYHVWCLGGAELEGPMSDVEGETRGLYSEVQYIMDNVTWGPPTPVNIQAGVKTLLSRKLPVSSNKECIVFLFCQWVSR